MGIILKAENLSKQYRLGTVGTGTMGDDLKRWWYMVRGKEDPFLKVGAVNDRGSKANQDYVWALRDIDFEVKQGEVLGIIGKNGAGKSTLLKLLSRVTAPTIGSIKTKGRIASLLEIGTGFHPELTGRENIYMNGAVLGMTKSEIKSKLDEIIAFSGCEKYIDTPVKRYSSGMTVRLGFAVAAHLEPEILVVDEVLAVGDAEFQKKAIGKMQDLSTGQGRTVIFVSHNMVSIEQLCDKCLWIESGYLKSYGDTEKVINEYLNSDKPIQQNVDLKKVKERKGNQEFIFQDISFFDRKGNEILNSIRSGIYLQIKIKYFSKREVNLKNTQISVGFSENGNGNFLFNCPTKIFNYSDILPLQGELILSIPKFPLSQGKYSITLFSEIGGEVTDWLKECYVVDVVNGDFFNTGKLPHERKNSFYVEYSWKTN